MTNSEMPTDACMGMDKTTFAVVVPPEVIACVYADFPRVFLTIVVVQNEYLGARTPKCARWMVNISEVNYAWKKVLRKYKLCLSRICRHFGIRHSLNLVNGDTVLNVTLGTEMWFCPYPYTCELDECYSKKRVMLTKFNIYAFKLVLLKLYLY
jgi:hypothetical protein